MPTSHDKSFEEELNEELLRSSEILLAQQRAIAKTLKALLKTYWKDREMVFMIHQNLNATNEFIGEYENEIKDRSSRRFNRESFNTNL